ncbi:hypothetical protein Oweho_3425 [Owenweeksia hongkongensis DSM 17368]|uniref:Uncharacterized protein n=1 Tax=Owenweeksia hongkongensis (strain DSM 17368 / CIP 108786 / JCM 12287 / NRRL B-23963 / UST20020801) TaxID=926562 RepID=G8R5Q8_OWEHD|nr:hypothetical protein [Owenweeksia hongkongensis]AEV34374.1 hypothetical protein Oweho_3425 [Owenweeksia hongkongensis DSM 17368]
MKKYEPWEFIPYPTIQSVDDPLTYELKNGKEVASFQTEDRCDGSITKQDGEFILTASFRGKNDEYRKKKMRSVDLPFETEREALQYWFDNKHTIWIKLADMRAPL